MDKRAIISVAIGTIVLFIWGMVSWMVLPFHGNSLNAIPDGALDTQEMKNLMPESGVYHFPGMPEDNTEAAMKEVCLECDELTCCSYCSFLDAAFSLS